MHIPVTAAAKPWPTRAGAAVFEAARSVVSTLGLAFGSIFFIPNPWIGLLLWVALLLRDPPSAAFALLGLAVAGLCKWLLRITDAPVLGGGVKANGLLAAILTGWMTSRLGISWGEQLALAAASAAVATVLAAALIRALSASVFPSLLWAYCSVAAMMFAVCPECTVKAAKGMQPWLPPTDATSWLDSFLRSMGSLMYLPQAQVGIFVCLAILFWSRAMFFAGLAGWVAGVAAALAFQEMGLPHDWLALSYNYFVAGMALGAAVFLPGRASLLVAAAGGALTAFFALALQYAAQWSAVSYLPISSGAAIWVGLGALTLARSAPVVERNAMPDVPPEQAWWQVAYWARRFGPQVPLFAAPVPDVLQVSQGFGGSLSHTGRFRHGLDFQRPVALGSIWGASVFAPAAGYVERARDGVPDNALGECNYADRWGNHVVIRLDAGGWALLGHLQHGTTAVAPGMRVETGTYIGRVGNSGRSPVPHLHLHLQESPAPGSATSPFRLANYLAGKPGSALTAWVSAAVPREGDAVMAAPLNTAVYRTLAGFVPGSAVWSVESTGRIPRAFRPARNAATERIDVVVDELGRHVFRAGRTTGMVCRFDPDAWRVIELAPGAPPLLKLLALAVPSVPFAARPGMTWNDVAPAAAPAGLFGAIVLGLAPYFRRNFLDVACECLPVPVAAKDRLALGIASRLRARSSSLPSKVTCEFALLRGPVRVQAEFHGGSLVYSLLSYEPVASSEEGRAR